MIKKREDDNVPQEGVLLSVELVDQLHEWAVEAHEAFASLTEFHDSKVSIPEPYQAPLAAIALNLGRIVATVLRIHEQKEKGLEQV